MGLETGTYIDSLVATNPTSGDLKSEGDDHIRLIKATIKASFPNVTGAASLTHGQLSGVSTPLTGTPTAPTASANANSTQIATTAYVDATFVAGAYPSVTGNTGKFLTNDGSITSWGDAYTEAEADALLLLKAALASPALTGVPTAPTAAADTDTTQIATTAFVTTEDNLKADLASPTLTGTPAAPTADPATDTTQIATTAFVEAESVLLRAADDLKADLASPTLTDVPLAPTAAAGTDTTQIATTEFVLANTMYDAYVRLVDAKATTTVGGTFTSGSWVTRDIAEDVDASAICSVTANVITLAAGTYRTLIRCQGHDVRMHQARLRDNADTTTYCLGSSASASGNLNVSDSVISDRFTLAAETAIVIEHRCNNTTATTGLGYPNSFGEDEIYTVAEFWREN